jgi:hypothetical protein
LSYARRLTIAVSAICLIAALAAPTAGAAGSHSKASASKSAKLSKKSAAKAAPKARAAQSARRLARAIRTINRRSKSNRRNITRLRRNLAALGPQLRAAIAGGDKTIDDKINGIVGVVTPVLQRLGDGLTLVGGKLQELADATIAGFAEVSAGFDAVEAGFGEVEAALTDIGDFLGSSKYGILQLAVEDDQFGATDDADAFPDVIPGCFYVTENMSDEVQPAILTGQCNTTGADAGSDLHFLAGIRSNESDGTGPTDPAGTAGIIAYDQRDAAGNQVGGGATPVISAQTGPTVPINTGVPVTNEDEPTFMFGPVSTDIPGLVNIADASTFQGAPDPPVVATGGNIVTFTVRFLDLTADADDPTA